MLIPDSVAKDIADKTQQKLIKYTYREKYLLGNY